MGEDETSRYGSGSRNRTGSFLRTSWSRSPLALGRRLLLLSPSRSPLPRGCWFSLMLAPLSSLSPPLTRSPVPVLAAPPPLAQSPVAVLAAPAGTTPTPALAPSLPLWEPGGVSLSSLASPLVAPSRRKRGSGVSVASPVAAGSAPFLLLSLDAVSAGVPASAPAAVELREMTPASCAHAACAPPVRAACARDLRTGPYRFPRRSVLLKLRRRLAACDLWRCPVTRLAGPDLEELGVKKLHRKRLFQERETGLLFRVS